ncbi:MAG: NAD-dependent epimerase/dehydratase family protein [Myxococcota bacterium]
MSTVLVTGVAGGLAQAVCRALREEGVEVVGVDYRPPQQALPEGVRFFRASYNKTGIEDVFRRNKIDAVLHLGRVGDLRQDSERRFDLNVVGTQKIMNLCVEHGVKRLVVLSTFHIYGAHPANHTPIQEDEPLRAGLEFPEIGDAIQLDNMASTWIYRHPEVSTAVLRMVNVVGPSIKNSMSQFLRAERVPFLLGYNPMVQFIHEEDAVRALLLACRKPIAGVFNVAGSDVVPWKTALKLTGAKLWPIPSSLVSAALKVGGWFPAYLVNFFRYPCIISDRSFRTRFGWSPSLSIEETLWSTVKDARARQRADR